LYKLFYNQSFYLGKILDLMLKFSSNFKNSFIVLQDEI